MHQYGLQIVWNISGSLSVDSNIKWAGQHLNSMVEIYI